ncbi:MULTISPECIES: phage/plasmid primase, P4 family [Brucella]|uniref:Phage/plasmid primase P4 family protein n=1 Tax=Brucella intermedia M86 TaxID=1234597 RepID=M5JR19_9HYPH|nr:MULTISPECIES: DNA primase family protein [Brucella]ELT50260.1 phage/plasmid primase P4 family protein [Brucella intermedia M86]
MTKNTQDIPAAVRAIMAEASRQAEAAEIDPRNPATDGLPDAHSPDDGEPAATARGDRSVDREVVRACAALDHSDTDNAERLQRHFGEDMLVLAQSKARKATYAIWDGTHWDIDTGDPRSLAIAQQLGGRIAMETEFLQYTPAEEEAVKAGKEALAKPEDERSRPEKKLADAALNAKANLAKRKKRRMDHAVTSKNRARLEAMLTCLAPHVMRSPDDFNADPLKVALLDHTLVFSREVEHVRNPAFDDPDDNREDIPETIERKIASVKAIKGHRRGDLITQIIPVAYQKNAKCPKWDAFLKRMLPSDDVRRMVQVASGLGLVGLTVQKLFFHYGFGANGKSVYMETLCRLLGDVSVTLPSESFIGEGNSGGAASPDMARLYGRRFLRVKELPEGEDLRENLVKDLTGGEDFTVRDLFQGYFDFKPIFTGHMSGNGYPRITGTDNGIWRRMVVVHWPVTLKKEEQREFEEVVSEFQPEYPGILNWLIEGVLIFLREGLVIPASVEAKTQEYRDEMDPTSAFCARCIEADERGEVTAKDFYQAYVDFTVDQGGKPISLTRFGLIMKKKYRREDGRAVKYHGLRLIEVPKPAHTSGSDDYEAHMR